MSERRPAQTIGELDIHVGNVQETQKQLLDRLSLMATKSDLDAVINRIIALEERVEQQTVTSWFNKTTNVILRLGAVGGVIGAAWVAIKVAVHILDGIKP